MILHRYAIPLVGKLTLDEDSLAFYLSVLEDEDECRGAKSVSMVCILYHSDLVPYLIESGVVLESCNILA